MTSQFPGGEMPGMTAMNDTLAFVKKLWGGMQVPGMVTPTISIDDLDKKIKDLKTVESWLNVNMNMLRGTIQALEVQRATIATLNSLGASFSNAMGSAEAAGTSSFSSDAYTAPAATNPEWPMPPAGTQAKPESFYTHAPAEPEPAADPETDADTDAEEDTADVEGSKEEASAASQFVNPAAWWTLLQDQFKQAVNNAMAGELTAKETPTAEEPKKAATKPATKTATKPANKTAKPAAKKTAKAPAKAGTAKAANQASAKPASKPVDKAGAAKSSVAKPKPVSIGSKLSSPKT
ncbi:PhaM family polyhydroxyalkanoate granule multifunctional regulatory protein [Undibacterium terreum]|uniref:Tfp pilus assembly protein FimV n=1 Tax=Undibacterium terreum TaxID=1224302 RepID=A0A916UWG8_9BURK|nr:PhaM family polyhydroxyalkanoate granule multifunctional regulatory protein [Undibacterium terreum]GGC88479.1 hypothetical protein GCM10011396_39600 [Undibacterium terreum]